MAQAITYDNKMQITTKFSKVIAGNIFIYNCNMCIKLSGSSPNYAIIGTGASGTLDLTENVYLPSRALVKVE